MIPVIFPYDAVTFTTHGLGDLMETMRCESSLNSDGEYELELEYPADGRYTNQLLIDNIIVAKVNDHQQNQAFRIYSIEKTINRTILVHAQHLSYDLKYWLHDPFWARTCSGAVRELRYAIGSDGAFNFNITTDVPNSTPAQNIDQKLKIEEPKSVRAILLDGDNSIKGTFGCDLIFDNWDIFLAKVGGADRGVLIEYGIDMVDMQQEENISEMITGVYPYWKGSQSQGENDEQQDVPYTNIYVEDPDDDSDDSNVVIPGDVIYAQGNFKRHHIVPLNISEYWVEDNRFPTRDEIDEIARNWITANHIGEPAVNLTISYAALPKNKNIRIHDAVTVNFVKMGIQTTAKVEAYKYDVLKERCIEITVGKAKPTILFDLEDASRLKRGLIPPKRIQNKSIQSQHIEPHTLESFQLSDGVVQSLGYADQFNAATLEDPVYETLPEHFSAKEMSILPQEGLDPLTLLNGVEATNLFLTVGKNVRIGETIYAQNFIVTIDRGIMESPMFCFPENENGEVIIAERAGYNVNHHTHTLTADEDGKVHIGKPDFLGKDNFFNIADTKFYKDHVSAKTIDEFVQAVYMAQSATNYTISLSTTSPSSTALQLVGGNLTGVAQINYQGGDRHDYVFVSMKTTDLITIDEITPYSVISESQADKSLKILDAGWTRYNSSDDFIYGAATIKLKNGVEEKVYVALDASGKPTALYEIPRNTISGSIDSYPYQEGGISNKNKALVKFDFKVDGNDKTIRDDIDVTDIYEAGEIAGKAYATPTSIVRRTNLATGQPMPDSWNNNTNTGYIFVRAKNNAEDIYKDDTLEVTTDSAIYQAGKAYATPTSIVRRTNLATGQPMPDSWNNNTNTGYIFVRAKNNAGDIYKDDTLEVTTDSAIYQAGVTAGKADATDITSSDVKLVSLAIDSYPLRTDVGGGVYTTDNSKANVKGSISIREQSYNKWQTLDVSQVYNSGLSSATIDTNYNSVTVNNSHLSQNSHHYIVVTVKGRAKGTYIDGSPFYSSAGTVLNQYKFLADDVYNAGASGTSASYSIPISTISGTIEEYPYIEGGISNVDKALVAMSFKVDGHSKTVRKAIDVSNVYAEGRAQGQSEGSSADYYIPRSSMSGSITQYPYYEGGIWNNQKALVSISFTVDGISKTVSDDIDVSAIFSEGESQGGGGTPIAKFYLEYTGIWYRTNYGDFYQHRICSVTQVNDEYVSESTPRLIYIVGNTYDGYYD